MDTARTSPQNQSRCQKQIILKTTQSQGCTANAVSTAAVSGLFDCTKKACKASKIESTAVIQQAVLVVSSKVSAKFQQTRRPHKTASLLDCKSKTGASPWPLVLAGDACLALSKSMSIGGDIATSGHTSTNKSPFWKAARSSAFMMTLLQNQCFLHRIPISSIGTPWSRAGRRARSRS